MASDDLKSVTHGPFMGETAGSLLILSDCEGTLYNVPGIFGINTKLVRALLNARELGFEVVLFSNDPHGAALYLKGQAELMAMYGDDSLFELLYGQTDLIDFIEQPTMPEIASKSEYDGKKAMFVYDDDHRSHGVDAEYELSPTEKTIEQLLATGHGIKRNYPRRGYTN